MLEHFDEFVFVCELLPHGTHFPDFWLQTPDSLLQTHVLKQHCLQQAILVLGQFLTHNLLGLWNQSLRSFHLSACPWLLAQGSPVIAVVTVYALVLGDNPAAGDIVRHYVSDDQVILGLAGFNRSCPQWSLPYLLETRSLEQTKWDDMAVWGERLLTSIEDVLWGDHGFVTNLAAATCVCVSHEESVKISALVRSLILFSNLYSSEFRC